VSIDSSFCVQNARFDRFLVGRLAQVVCDLCIQKAQTITTTHAEFCAIQ